MNQFLDNEDFIPETNLAIKQLIALEELSHISKLSNINDYADLVVNKSLMIDKNRSLGIESISSRLLRGIAMEDDRVYDYSTRTVNFIISESENIMKWLNKSISHLHDNKEQYSATINSQIKEINSRGKISDAVAKKTIISNTIVRNLITGKKVVTDQLSINADKFLTKTNQIQSSVMSAEFRRLVSMLKEFKLTNGDDESKIIAIIKQLDSYIKTILPAINRKNDFYGLKQVEHRLIRTDNQIYLGDRIFYSYSPLDLGNNSGDIFSGIIRTTLSDVDLKQPIPYLSTKQITSNLGILKKHLEDINIAKEFISITDTLQEIIVDCAQKYKNSIKSKNLKINAKHYILIMNIANSLLYGLHIKTLSQSDGLYRTILKYNSIVLNDK